MTEQLIFFLYDRNKKKTMFLVFEKPSYTSKNHIIERLEEIGADKYEQSVI